ncbi:MAG: hypothetical protein U9N32_08215 [Spirochaetota bacterium]|nr:hypothetical protein [Spirochaetota bacterium]
MKTTNIISPRRLISLLKRDILSNINTTLITLGAVTALIYLISAITAYNRAPYTQLYFTLFTNLLFVGGFIVTSMIFKEMHRKETAQNYLLIPASNFEKFFSRLLISTIGFALITLIGITAISYLSEGVNTLIFKRHNDFFNPFSKIVWTLMAHYLVAQSIFFLGAVYFRKYHFIKTINIIFLIQLSITIIAALFVRIVYFDLFDGFFSIGDTSLFIKWEALPLNAGSFTNLIKTLKILYWLVPAPLFWTISYFRIKEVEVKNAI